MASLASLALLASWASWASVARVGMPPGIGLDFTDVTLETKNEAHKMVLISASHKQIQQKIEQLLLKNKHTTERSKVHN